MKTKLETRGKFIINVLYFALAAALLYIAVRYILAWIMPFIIGFLVALMLKPAINFLSAKSKIPRKLTAIVLVLLFYAVAIVLLALVGIKIIMILEEGFASLPDIFTQYIEPTITRAFERLEELTARLDPNMAQVVESMTESLSSSAGSVVTSISTQVIKYLSATVTSLPGLLLAVLLTIISSVFLACDFKRISEYMISLLPEKMRSYPVRFKSLAAELGFKYIKSYALLLMITFIELSIGFMILGVNNAVVVAALIAVIDLLPVLGTGAVVIPWIIVELLMGNITFAIGLSIIYVVITIVRNILEPRIVGGQIGVHPLAMLISMYVGLRIFGFVGIFVLPVTLIIVKGFYDKNRAEAREQAEMKQDA